MTPESPRTTFASIKVDPVTGEVLDDEGEGGEQ